VAAVVRAAHGQDGRRERAALVPLGIDNRTVAKPKLARLRAYASAVARVGLNEQTAMVLTGHSDAKVHQRYVEVASIRELPAAAVPYVDPNAARLVANRFEPRAVSKAPRANALFPEREKGFEPSTSTLARWHSTAELLPQIGVAFVPAGAGSVKGLKHRDVGPVASRGRD
jgi:hypothetical protein